MATAAGGPGLHLFKRPQARALKGTLPSRGLCLGFVCSLDALVRSWWFAPKLGRTTRLCGVQKHLGTKHQAGMNLEAPGVQYLSLPDEDNKARRREGLSKATKLHSMYNINYMVITLIYNSPLKKKKACCTYAFPDLPSKTCAYSII